MIDTRTISIMKAISWRLISSIVTFLIALWILRDTATSIGIVILDCCIKIALYYLHERAWVRIKLSKKEEKMKLKKEKEDELIKEEEEKCDKYYLSTKMKNNTLYFL